MTEEEWLASNDPMDMVELFIPSEQQPSCVRKLRLFAVSCCRNLFREEEDSRVVSAVDTLELFADGRATEEEVTGVYRPVSDLARYVLHTDAVWNAVAEVAADATHNAIRMAWSADELTRKAAEWRAGTGAAKSECALHVALLRDIFGNPFRPVLFSPSWRTDTALTLARQMYESRDFGAMPILADALQDAGCDNDDNSLPPRGGNLLNHCRDTSLTHVRGCWVTDLVLGKE
jgi:hypothetical protein